MNEEEQISVNFPNLQPQFVPRSVVEKWDIIDTNTIGDTVFCKFEDRSYISMGLEDYNRIFNEK